MDHYLKQFLILQGMVSIFMYILNGIYSLLDRLGASQCVQCGRYGSVLCKSCANRSLTFALPSRLLGFDTVVAVPFKSSIMAGFKRYNLEYIGTQHSITTEADTGSVIYLTHLYSLFYYNSVVRRVVSLYKTKAAFSISISLFRALIAMYQNVDPFGLLYNLSTLYNVLISRRIPLLVFSPGSIRIKKRGFDHVRLIINSLLVGSLGFKVFHIPVYTGSNIKMSYLNRANRMRAYRNWYIKSKYIIQIKKYMIKIFNDLTDVKYCVPIIIFDDIVTTGSTMKELITYVVQFLRSNSLLEKYQYNFCIIPMSFFKTPRRCL